MKMSGDAEMIPAGVKDQLEVLMEREERFWSQPNLALKCNKRKTGEKQMINSEEISYEHRDLASEWMYEVVIDSGVHLDVFLHSVSVMDCFLDICPILDNQVQLLASACLLLAAKVRRQERGLTEAQIVDYTDNAITIPELQAWEMLVLSKLDWDINLVIALDYLEPLNSLSPRSKLQQQQVQKKSKLICSLSCRYATFRAIFSPKVVAMAALNLDIPPLFQVLKITKTDLAECAERLSSQEGSAIDTTPTKSLSSPFKVESSSTPNSKVNKDNNKVSCCSSAAAGSVKRRLTSLNDSLEMNKENNDSAIGLLTPTCSSSGSSSKNSSPDSGTGAITAKSNLNNVLQDLDNLLESTHISP